MSGMLYFQLFTDVKIVEKLLEEWDSNEEDQYVKIFS